MSSDDPIRFTDGRMGGHNQVEVADLGGGLFLTLDIPEEGTDPDPTLVIADVLRRIGLAVTPLGRPC